MTTNRVVVRPSFLLKDVDGGSTFPMMMVVVAMMMMVMMNLAMISG